MYRFRTQFCLLLSENIGIFFAFFFLFFLLLTQNQDLKAQHFPYLQKEKQPQIRLGFSSWCAKFFIRIRHVVFTPKISLFLLILYFSFIFSSLLIIKSSSSQYSFSKDNLLFSSKTIYQKNLFEINDSFPSRFSILQSVEYNPSK